MNTQCTCPESLSQLAELCDHCALEYTQWLEDEAADSRAETLMLSTAEWSAALESFNAKSELAIANLTAAVQLLGGKAA